MSDNGIKNRKYRGNEDLYFGVFVSMICSWYIGVEKERGRRNTYL